MTNTTKASLLLIPAILVEVTASLALKGALEHPALYVVVVIGYLSGFVLLAEVLRTGMALGLAPAGLRDHLQQGLAPSWFWTEAPVTITHSSRPVASTAMWHFRPLTFCPHRSGGYQPRRLRPGVGRTNR